ncbi:aldo/keto reductase [Kutzneria sp. NPDC052558]|uniref:aldo/keto reductase n=1 Tax=Kutzneria sp. NPDC052558 TaxID=3364121 RepID=UPI0037C85D3A
MNYRTLGRSGLRVSPLALGAMLFGDAQRGCDRATAHEILARYVEAGGNVVDTANIYAGGRSEEIVGEFLSRQRDRIVLATKFGGSMTPGDPNAGGGGRKAIMQQVEGSLRRLGTDYIDLYWLHGQDPHTGIQETMSTLDDLVRSGKLRHIGFSDTPAWQVARAGTIAELRGWAPLVALQPEYSLLARTVEGETFGVARELGLGVMPWSPLAGGVLSGRHTRDGHAADSGRVARFPLTEATFAVVDRLRAIADRQDSTVPAVALAWVSRQPLVSSVIIGTRSVDQLAGNMASLDVTFTADELADLETMTRPELGFPYQHLAGMAQLQQAGVIINA